jgi:hypothetical protein
MPFYYLTKAWAESFISRGAGVLSKKKITAITLKDGRLNRASQ